MLAVFALQERNTLPDAVIIIAGERSERFNGEAKFHFRRGSVASSFSPSRLPVVKAQMHPSPACAAIGFFARIAPA